MYLFFQKKTSPYLTLDLQSQELIQTTGFLYNFPSESKMPVYFTPVWNALNFFCE
jgi:hypothetical protein